jgi:DNA topoisomerase-1
MPLVSKKPKSGKVTVAKKPPKVTETALRMSDDSDAPLGAKLAKKKEDIEKRAEAEAKAIRKEESKAKTTKKVKREASDDEDESPVKKKRQPNGTSATKPATNGIKKDVKKETKKGVKKEESDDDGPLARKETKKAAKPKAKVEAPSPKKKASKVKQETEEDQEAEDQEEEYRWWEDPTKGDGTIKWTTLQHGGVVFPPPYEPLPKNVKLLYDGIPVTLSTEAEEVAGFFGSMLNSTLNVENPTFQKNFFEDFTTTLKETGGAKDKNGNKVNIKDFSKLDFTQIFNYYDAQRMERKALPSAEKKRLKAEKDAAEAPYAYCMWDGRKQKVGNFRVEPPGLFRGRGEHPKTGHVKKRVLPEQITINIGKEATVPAPPEGHRWKEVKHDQEGTWLAMWQENINGAYKYVMLAANSDVKGQSDHKKFEKARELKVCLFDLLYQSKTHSQSETYRYHSQGLHP